MKQLYKDLDVVYIKRKILEWLGHLIRRDNNIVIKKTFHNKQDGRRKVGTTRLRNTEREI